MSAKQRSLSSSLGILLEDLLSVSFVDDIVVCTMEKDYLLAHSHLQEICDSVVVWRLFVKLVFNGVKSFFMTFSPKSNLPLLSLILDNIIVPRSSSCLHLGLIIDDKLNWNQNITNKCNAVKKNAVLAQ